MPAFQIFFALAVAASQLPADTSPAISSTTTAGTRQAFSADTGSFIREEDHRVARIGYRIGLAGASLCPEAYPLTGLSLHHLAEYASADRADAARLYALDRGPGVLSVVENSPAARAGLRAGDTLLAVNDAPFATPVEIAQGRDNEEARPAIEATEAQLEAALRKGPARLSVSREGEEILLRLESLPGCPARVRLARSNQVNAFANRGYAIMTTALLEFFRNDDELAIVLAHEIAHNVLNHPAELEAQGVPRGILRGFGKNASRVRATEEEADRLGIKLAWAAGYDVAAAIPYWRRFYAKYDVFPQLFRTHPSLGARERLIRDVIAELGAGGSDSGAERP